MKNSKNLPRCVVFVKQTNPAWYVARDAGASPEELDQIPYYADPKPFAVEVMTLNLNSGTMRVRVPEENKTDSSPTGCWDTDIAPFFESNTIEAK